MRIIGLVLAVLLIVADVASACEDHAESVTSQPGVYKEVKVSIKKKANTLKAKCQYKFDDPPTYVAFTIGFDMATSKFKSKQVSVTNVVGESYEVENNPKKAIKKKYIVSFSVTFKGDVTPQGTCGAIQMPTTTAAPVTTPSMPTLPYSFTATPGTNWPLGGGTRFEASCFFAVTEPFEPNSKHFVIDYGMPVEEFEHWVGNQISPKGTSGSAFHLTNIHHLNVPVLEFYMQATYYGTIQPIVTCHSDLPQYVPTTTTEKVTTPKVTTQAPETTQKVTTQQPVTTPKVTTQKPVTTQKVTTNPPPDTTMTPGDSVPVEVIDFWNEGTSGGRMNARCSFHIPEAKDVNELKVNISFDATTSGYLDWVMNGNTAAGYSYYRTNKHYVNAGQFSFDFQVSFTGQNPPAGVCKTGTISPPVTTDPPATTPKGTTPKGTTPKGTTKPPGPTVETTTVKTGGDFNYNEVIKKSIWFYLAQRSGDLPVKTNDPVPWRGDSALYDGADVGLDLTGGWYDAGDYVKFNFPISSATAVLAWGLVQWEDGYKAAGQYNQMLDSIKWSLDFFLKCWKPATETLYGQVADGDIDHSKMMRPENMTESNMPRPAYAVTSSQGGSDLAGSMVAAFAAGAIAFKQTDPAYSQKLLNAAKSLYTFADKYRGKYTDAISDAGAFYPSSAYEDELVYAAAMLYKATGNQDYLADAEIKVSQFGFDGVASWAFDWSDKLMGAKLLLFEATGNSKYSSDVQKFLDSWGPGGSVTYTPGGLAWRGQWGSLRYAANTAFISLMAADMGINTNANRNWGKGQIHYMLGDNPRKSSYVVGFGNNPPKNPHHKASICYPYPAPCDWAVYSNGQDNAHTLYGALVGGPGSNDDYIDDRTDYVMAEVTCDYNAGFQSSVAGLVHFELVN